MDFVKSHLFMSYFLSSLSTVLHMCRTVQRIKRLTAGREAYIIPGAVNPDDITVADMLGEDPILVPE